MPARRLSNTLSFRCDCHLRWLVLVSGDQCCVRCVYKYLHMRFWFLQHQRELRQGMSSLLCDNDTLLTSSMSTAQCPPNSFILTDSCLCVEPHTTHDRATNTCACNSPYVRIPGSNCRQCPSNSVMSGSVCQCSIFGQTWSATTNTCSCPDGQYVDGQTCKACPQDATLTADKSTCSCKRSYWNFNIATGSCELRCPNEAFNSGDGCMCKYSGNEWRSSSNTCECQSGLVRHPSGQCITVSAKPYRHGTTRAHGSGYFSAQTSLSNQGQRVAALPQDNPTTQQAIPARVLLATLSPPA